MAFPSSVPSYTGFTSTHTLSQDQHAAQHNAEQGDIVALAQKVGTGASTPVGNSVLRGNGSGTTTYDQVHLNTDVINVLGTSNGGTGQNSLTGVPLVAPAITGGGSWTGAPTLSSPNISDFSNAQHGHTGASNGGQLSANAFANNAITAPLLATNAITLGYAQITTGASTTNTAATQVSGLAATVTVPNGGRNVKVTCYSQYLSNATSGKNAWLTLWSGTVGGGTQIQQAKAFAINNSTGNSVTAIAYVPAPGPGSVTYNVGIHSDSGGTAVIDAGATNPAFILVELI